MGKHLLALLSCLLLVVLLQAQAEPEGQKWNGYIKELCRRKYTGACGKIVARPRPRSDPLFSPRPQRAVGILKMPRIGRSDLLMSALDRRSSYDTDDAYPSYDFLGDNLVNLSPDEKDYYARRPLVNYLPSDSRFHYADQPITDNVNSQLGYKARDAGAERE